VTFSDMTGEGQLVGCSSLSRRWIIRVGHRGRSLNRKTRLPGARVCIMHASAIVVSGPTANAGSAGANFTAAANNSASGVSAAKTTSTTKYACTPFVTSCPGSVNQRDR